MRLFRILRGPDRLGAHGHLTVLFRQLRQREHRTVCESDPETDAISDAITDAIAHGPSDRRTDVFSDALTDRESIDESNSRTDAITDTLSDAISVESDPTAIEPPNAISVCKSVRTSDAITDHADRTADQIALTVADSFARFGQHRREAGDGRHGDGD